MKMETLQDLMNWTRQTHRHLSQCLERCETKEEKSAAKELLRYLADHEKNLARAVNWLEQCAEPETLLTPVEEYLSSTPIDPNKVCSVPYGRMSFDEISTSIVDTHNQLIDFYRYLYRQVENTDARDLAESLLFLEEHEALQLAGEVT